MKIEPLPWKTQWEGSKQADQTREKPSRPFYPSLTVLFGQKALKKIVYRMLSLLENSSEDSLFYWPFLAQSSLRWIVTSKVKGGF